MNQQVLITQRLVRKCSSRFDNLFFTSALGTPTSTCQALFARTHSSGMLFAAVPGLEQPPSEDSPSGSLRDHMLKQPDSHSGSSSIPPPASAAPAQQLQPSPDAPLQIPDSSSRSHPETSPEDSNPRPRGGLPSLVSDALQFWVFLVYDETFEELASSFERDLSSI